MYADKSSPEIARYHIPMPTADYKEEDKCLLFSDSCVQRQICHAQVDICSLKAVSCCIDLSLSITSNH